MVETNDQEAVKEVAVPRRDGHQYIYERKVWIEDDGGERRDREYKRCVEIAYATGKNSRVVYRQGSVYPNYRDGWQSIDGITVEVYGQKVELPLDILNGTEMEDFLKMIMAYDKTIEMLREMPANKRESSQQLVLKKEIEYQLTSGRVPEMDSDDYLLANVNVEEIAAKQEAIAKLHNVVVESQNLSDIEKDVARVSFIRDVVKKDLLPAVKLEKYPRTLDKMEKMLPKMMDKYTTYKIAQGRKDLSAIVKQENKQIRAAKLKARQELKLKEKEERQKQREEKANIVEAVL